MDSAFPPFPEGNLGLTLKAALETLRVHRTAELPKIEGLDGSMLARWLYRHWLEQHWLEQQAPWRPLLQLRAEHLLRLGERLEHGELTAQEWTFEGEFIHLVKPSSQPVPEVLQAAVRARKCWLLTDGTAPAQSDPSLSAPIQWIRQVQRLDAFHAVAVDPALMWLRRSLLSHCRNASPIHLTGEPGTEKGLLARWAHAVLDDRPLSRIQGTQGRPRPGEWTLFEEISELGEEQRHALEERLRAFDPLPPPPPPQAPGKRPRHPQLEHIIGQSAALSAVLEQVLLLAPRSLAVMILGESGVGKEAIARALHDLSGRTGPFVALDMGSIPESLAESELFGHRKGAFTGADHHRPGAFRTAHGGTLFLDEIGNASPGLQHRLIRVLQEGMVQPVGEDTPVPVNVRILSATNGDLDAMVRQGRFRADLLTRLSGAVLQIPALRERMDDIDALARHFLTGTGLKSAGSGPWCTPAARQILLHYAWPGNVRELSNILQFAAAMAPPGMPIDADHLGPLSPHHRRRVPLMTTSTHTGTEVAGGLERHLWQTMTAVTLTVPPLRDRDIAARTHAILSAVEGRPLLPAALRVLAASPWWGNHQELASRLSVLQGLPPGPVDLHILQHHLPEIMSPGGTAPIRVLLSPVAAGQGGVEGFTREFAVASLLVGRVRRMEELLALSRAGDARGKAWIDVIRNASGTTDPTCLELGHLTRLSRAHALITRGPQGLLAHGLPGVSLPVMAGTLEGTTPEKGAGERGPGELMILKPGAPILLGRGGELRIVTRGPVPYLQVFFFLGAIAYEELAPVALERTRHLPETVPATQENASMAVNLRLEPDSPGLHVWPLNATEVTALVELVASYRSGQLKVHVARALNAFRTPALERLREFLERAPRLSQYLVRLFEFPANHVLRERLRRRLAQEPDLETRLAILPEGIRRSLEGKDEGE